MSYSRDLDDTFDVLEQPHDATQIEAREFLRSFFEKHREQVFFSRQIEIQNENKYFHWVTNRAIRDLIGLGVLRNERRELKNAGAVNLLWHRSYRYFKRGARRVVELVEEYSDPNIGAAIGLQAKQWCWRDLPDTNS